MKRDIQERAFRFACVIVALHRELVQLDRTSRVLGDQLLRSGTSIGANLEEACAGQSRPDFISKCSIALKESRETLYWLKLMDTTELMPHNRLQTIAVEANELISILTAIARKARGE